MMNYVIMRTSSDELMHHGIKGQKWGVRRFQNEDRTWTEAGKERYGVNKDGKLSKDGFHRLKDLSDKYTESRKNRVYYSSPYHPDAKQDRKARASEEVEIEAKKKYEAARDEFIQSLLDNNQEFRAATEEYKKSMKNTKNDNDGYKAERRYSEAVKRALMDACRDIKDRSLKEIRKPKSELDDSILYYMNGIGSHIMSIYGNERCGID